MNHTVVVRMDGEQPISFFVDQDVGIERLHLEDADINVLRAAVTKRLREIKLIEPKRVFLVEYRGDFEKSWRTTDDETDINLRFRWELCEVGEAANGTKYYRTAHAVARNGRWSEGDLRELQSGWDGDDEVRAVALIPATEENRVALESIKSAFRATHKRLAGLVGSDQFAKRLAELGTTLALLPGPNGRKKG